jgi:hypothetical protein
MRRFLLLLFLTSWVMADTYTIKYQPNSGESISSSDFKNELTLIQTAVNGVDTNNITNFSIVANDLASNCVVNAKVSSSAEITADKITFTASDEDLKDALSTYQEGIWVYRVDDDTVGITVGTLVVNGELRRNTSATTADPTQLDAGDWTDIHACADTATSTMTFVYIDSSTTPGGSASGCTNSVMVGSIYWDATQDLNKTINYRWQDNEVVGWSYKQGASAQSATETLTFGVTFAYKPQVLVQYHGTDASAPPDDIGDLVNSSGHEDLLMHVNGITTTACTILYFEVSGNMGTEYHGYSFIAKGRFS